MVQKGSVLITGSCAGVKERAAAKTYIISYLAKLLIAAPSCHSWRGLSMSIEKLDKKKSSLAGKVCNNCLAPEGSASVPKLSACARCGLVLYCSKGCQRAHWKAKHKHNCITKADRVPTNVNPLDAHKDTVSMAAASGEKCAICQDLITGSLPSVTLLCTHIFHEACVAELRRFGVEQACPLCSSASWTRKALRGGCPPICSDQSLSRARQLLLACPPRMGAARSG